MRWEAVFAVFVISHLVGDFILQTEWQALNKGGGLTLRRTEARNALFSHVFVYTLVFIPAIVWLASSRTATEAGLLAVVFVPHLIQDDNRLLAIFNRRVKRAAFEPGDPVWMAVDQSFHMVVLFGTALLASS